MPTGVLVVFGIMAVIVALIFAFALMPPNKFVEMLDSKKRTTKKDDGRP